MATQGAEVQVDACVSICSIRVATFRWHSLNVIRRWLDRVQQAKPEAVVSIRVLIDGQKAGEAYPTVRVGELVSVDTDIRIPPPRDCCGEASGYIKGISDVHRHVMAGKGISFRN